MVKNLDVSTYRNGDPIPQVTDSATWNNLTTGAWCYYNNDPANGAIYGKLYNWYAVMDPRGLAPAGWHIPTLMEWYTTRDYLGGGNLAGGNMKSTGTSLWQSPNTGATNSSGFTALPGGYRINISGRDSYGIGQFGSWWANETQVATSTIITYNSARIEFPGLIQYWGNSVRCVRD
jgi:uncharacterized protein (TIGR02145 family)